MASLAKDFEAVVIEDNPCDAEPTMRALKRKGLAGKVKVFPDGVEALDFLLFAADAPGEFPKVIFLDLKLPKMSGLEVLRRLKGHERTRMIPVVMLTSSQEEPDILEVSPGGEQLSGQTGGLRRVFPGSGGPGPLLVAAQ
ncbi:MAG: response regulator [Desulfobaccales bacterium]